MNEILKKMLKKYQCKNVIEYENALKEIIQEIALLGLWRAKFFEKAAFYGGTALRILYGLDRFSEDLDFSLLNKKKNFSLTMYNKAIQNELESLGFKVQIENKEKNIVSQIESAFIKADTKGAFIQIEAPKKLLTQIHSNKILKIKFEVDTDPPLNFKTEAKALFQPIPFFITTYQLSDLFAGKVHAVLCRKWKNRIKGRDWYDLVWYVSNKTPLRLKHLESRLKQSGHIDKKLKLSKEIVYKMLLDKISTIDFESAKADVLPFIKDVSQVQAWSRVFFQQVADAIEVVDE